MTVKDLGDSNQTTAGDVASSARPVDERRVFIVDDHPVVRMGLGGFIHSTPDLMVCGDCAEAPDSLSQITETRPDVVLVDISLKKSNGLQLISRLRAGDCGVPILAISMHDEALYAARVAKAGANGFLSKALSPDDLLAGIRKALDGHTVFSEGLDAASSANGGVVANGGVTRLSNRELEVFELLGKGNRTRDIADVLKLSIKTVETHQASIKRKLQLRDYTDMVRTATGWMNQIDLGA